MNIKTTVLNKQARLRSTHCTVLLINNPRKGKLIEGTKQSSSCWEWGRGKWKGEVAMGTMTFLGYALIYHLVCGDGFLQI